MAQRHATREKVRLECADDADDAEN